MFRAKFRARFSIDAPLAERHPSGSWVALELSTTVPFLPVAGMHVSVAKDGDYFEVEDVYWSAEQPGAIDVFVKEREGSEHGPEYLERQGWKRSVD